MDNPITHSQSTARRETKPKMVCVNGIVTNKIIINAPMKVVITNNGLLKKRSFRIDSLLLQLNMCTIVDNPNTINVIVCETSIDSRRPIRIAPNVTPVKTIEISTIFTNNPCAKMLVYLVIGASFIAFLSTGSMLRLIPGIPSATTFMINN